MTRKRGPHDGQEEWYRGISFLVSFTSGIFPFVAETFLLLEAEARRERKDGGKSS